MHKKGLTGAQKSGGKRDNRKTLITERRINQWGEYKERQILVDRVFSDRGYIFKYNAEYIKMLFNGGLPNECTIADCGRFYRLLQYIVKENQLLGYRSNKIKPLTASKMAKIFNCSERVVKSFLKKMKDLKILKEVSINDEKWYAVNPLYALKSKYLSLTTYIIFQDELEATLPKDIVEKFKDKTKKTQDTINIEE